MSQEFILFKVCVLDSVTSLVTEIVVTARTKEEAEIRACAFIVRSKNELSSSVRVVDSHPVGGNTGCFRIREMKFQTYKTKKERTSPPHIIHNKNIKEVAARSFSEKLTPEEKKMTQSEYQAKIIEKEKKAKDARKAS